MAQQQQQQQQAQAQPAASAASAASEVPKPGEPTQFPFVRGASPLTFEKYSGKTLKCLRNGEEYEFPIAILNDNYCDCDDGLDEPGTSACAHLQKPLGFFCASGEKPILSSRVNDGYCDCCDGSDEWDSEVICADICAQLHEERLRNEEIMEEGRKIRMTYIHEGKMARNTDQAHADWGPDDAFYPLTTKCFEIKKEKYVYKLCFFKDANQIDHGRSTSIGSHFVWLDRGRTGAFQGGAMCPNGKAREAAVNFHCGKEDKILAMMELETCHYSFDFQTPAACL